MLSLAISPNTCQSSIIAPQFYSDASRIDDPLILCGRPHPYRSPVQTIREHPIIAALTTIMEDWVLFPLMGKLSKFTLFSSLPNIRTFGIVDLKHWCHEFVLSWAHITTFKGSMLSLFLSQPRSSTQSLSLPTQAAWRASRMLCTARGLDSQRKQLGRM